MLSAARCRCLEAAAVLLGFFGLAGAAAASPAPAWRVLVRGVDATRAAGPSPAGGALLVDLARLAPYLGIEVRTAQGEVLLRDTDGRLWRGAAGSSILTAPGRTMGIERPLRVEGGEVYAPVALAADLAGLELTLDPDAGLAELRARTAGAPDGWSAVSLAKPTPAPGADRAVPERARRVFLPPDHESLRVGLGLGVVPGVDQEAELTASGSVRGVQTALAALVTSGPRGFDLYSGHVSLDDPGRGWGGEAGDLASPLWGFTRGLRALWYRGADRGEDAEPAALSLYVDDRRASNGDTLLAYRDDLPLGSHAAVGGEAASDGSWFARTRIHTGGFRLFVYHRDAGGRLATRSDGLAASLDLPGGALVQGGASRGGEGPRYLATGDLSLRVPFGRAAVTLEGSRMETQTQRTDLAALGAELSLGGFYGLVRFQHRTGELLGVPGRSLSWRQEEGLATLSSRWGRRLLWDVQLWGSLPDLGDPVFQGQLQLAWALSPSTSLAVLAAGGTTPGAGTFRVRLDRELRPGLALSVEYGDVPTFQATAAERRDRFRLLVRRSWDVATPAEGGVVEGVVASGTPRPAAGVPVELGPYRTVTGEDGRYAFRNVPRGSYELRVTETELPAAYGAAGAGGPVTVARRDRQRRDLAVVPLGEARGFVYVDRDGDGRRGPGEGVAGIVVRLDDWATATGADGGFGFYNLPPGAHRLRLDGDRLPSGLAATIPMTIDLGLPAGRSIDGLELRLAERRKPVVFQELGR